MYRNDSPTSTMENPQELSVSGTLFVFLVQPGDVNGMEMDRWTNGPLHLPLPCLHMG